MMKSTIFAVLGLATALTLATPQKANAGVIIGVGVGARPAYGYVVVHPRPYAYYAHPYTYAPGYAYPAYGFYGRFGPVRPWGRREFVRNDRFGNRGWRGGYRR